MVSSAVCGDNVRFGTRARSVYKATLAAQREHSDAAVCLVTFLIEEQQLAP